MNNRNDKVKKIDNINNNVDQHTEFNAFGNDRNKFESGTIIKIITNNNPSSSNNTNNDKENKNK